MKRIHLISILLILGAIAMLISASDDMSTYSSFSEARSNGGTVKIAGHLAKDRDMVYHPDADPNLFKFWLVDDTGTEEEVTLLAPKPQDFELSEQIVVTGVWKDDKFEAHSVLLKCPSKYKNEEIFLKDEKQM